ncbi:MAG: hypothetical protein A4E44_00897 [Methanosaeta sp. PtaB.Bin018]|nr:MAG: hypothetical protein A4E44_00897 [Methanosaeta sp. PtaB.Bin018]OPY43363.1 MAG: hypothetical protein A4E46_01862 [Methanosaeta sp. PtaU1.Bin016]
MQIIIVNDESLIKALDSFAQICNKISEACVGAMACLRKLLICIEESATVSKEQYLACGLVL